MGHTADGVAEFFRDRNEGTIEQIQDFIEKQCGYRPTPDAIRQKHVKVIKYGINLQLNGDVIRRME
jgi:hypothetical protein